MRDIKLFGKCIFSTFHHYVYELKSIETFSDLSHKFNQLTYINYDNINEINGGDFNPKNAYRILRKNPNKVEGYFAKDGEGNLVGYFFLAYKNAREFHYRVTDCDAFIFDFCILPTFRQKGFSKLLLFEVLNVAVNKGASTIRLVVKKDNLIAIKAYESFGFKRIGEKKIYRFLRIDFPKQSI